jgi:hypothetical protein
MEKSVAMAKEAITIDLPFSGAMRSATENIEKARGIINYWGQDAGSFLNSLQKPE